MVCRVGGSPGSGPAGLGAKGVRYRADGWGVAAAGRGAGRDGGPVRVPRHGADGRCRALPRDRGRPGYQGQRNVVVGMDQPVRPGAPGARPAAGAHRRSPTVRRADHDRYWLTAPTGGGSEVAALLRPDRRRGGRAPGVAPRPVRVTSPVPGAGRGRPADSVRRARATEPGRRAGPGGRTDRARSRCAGCPVPGRGRPPGNHPAPVAGLGPPPGVSHPAIGGAAPRRGGRGGRPVRSRSGRCRSRRGGSAPAGVPWPDRRRQLVRAGQAVGCAQRRCHRGSAGRGTADATRSSARPSRTARWCGATGRTRRDSSVRPVGVDEGAAPARGWGLGRICRERRFAFGRAPMTGSRPLAHGDCHLVAPCRAGRPPAGSVFRPARRSCGRRVAARARLPPLWRPRGTQTLSHVPEIWVISGPEFGSGQLTAAW